VVKCFEVSLVHALRSLLGSLSSSKFNIIIMLSVYYPYIPDFPPPSPRFERSHKRHSGGEREERSAI
jgi:hypothetical protein